MFKVKILGDNLVLLIPKAEERMEDIVKLNNGWFDCFFDDIKPWTESLVVSYKRVWVRCYGLPLQLWNKECFSKITEDVATLVEVDGATLSWNRLEYARFKVCVLKSRKVELAKGVRINGRMYNIALVEEVNSYEGEDNKCKCAYNHESSSESNSSFDSFVEESLLSQKVSNDDGGEEGGRYWWPEKNKRERREWSTEKTKKGLEGECAEGIEICQEKSATLVTRKDVSLQGVVTEGTAVSATKQVNVACEGIQSALANLA